MGRNAHAAQLAGKLLCHFGLAMHHENLGRLWFKGVNPLHQRVVSGVGGQPLEVDNLGLDRNLFPKHLDLLRPVEQMTAKAALGLEAHENHRALGPPQVVLEMVADTAGITHAACRNDDLGMVVHVEQLGLLHRFGQNQVVKGQHGHAVAHQHAGLLVNVARQVSRENGGGLTCQRAIDIYGEVGQALHKPSLLDFADEIQQLLRASHRKGGDDHIAALLKGLVHDGGQVLRILTLALVVAVAVSGLHDHIVGLFDKLRVTDDGLVGVAQVPRKDQLFGDAILGHPQLHNGGAQQMARVNEAELDALAQRLLLFVVIGLKPGKRLFRVFQRVKRLHRLGTGTLALAVLILRIRLLDVRRVAQHNAQKLPRQTGGHDAALIPQLDKQGQASRMVNVGMGDNHIVDFPRMKPELSIVDLVLALLQAAVNENALAAGIQTVTTAGDGLGRSVKCQFHIFCASFPRLRLRLQHAPGRRSIPPASPAGRRLSSCFF